MLNSKTLTDKIFWAGVAEGIFFTIVTIFASIGAAEVFIRVFG